MTETNDQKTAPQAGAKSAGDAERIAKVLARAGLCSRREAEEWVVAGRVAVNGKVLESPAFTVGPKDRVTVDGAPLPVKERTRLWLFHKPRGLVTTNQDPEGRPTVFSVLPEDMPRVVTVGRLDINTEGLLLLTNDGGVARVLELPSTGWLRRYRVRAFGQIEEQALKDLAEGVSIDGVDYGPIVAEIERVQGANVWLVLGLREGKNREVKRVLASLGLTVNRLIRVSFGPFQLADLEEGEIREIRGRVLRDQLGNRLVVESGADFDAPVVHHLQGDVDADEGKKRKIRAFTPAEEGGRDDRAPRRPARAKMEFVGTGEKRARDRGGEGGGDRPLRSAGFRGRTEGGPNGPRKGRSEGFRDRPDGGEGRPSRGRSGGFRDRPDGPEKKEFRNRPRPEGDARPPRRPRFDKPDAAGGDRPRAEGYRGRPDGDRPRSEGFRGRSDFDRPRSEGYRGRPDGDRPRSEGFRGRPDGDRPRSEGFRGRPDGERPRSEGFRGRPDGDRPRSEGFRGRPDGDRPRSEGFRGRPDGDRPRSEGFRGRPDGDRPRSEGYKGRSEGGKGRASSFRDRPESGAAPKKPARAEGFGPRGPRGMNPGGRKGGPDAGPKGPRGPKGPKGGGKGRGGRS